MQCDVNQMSMDIRTLNSYLEDYKNKILELAID